MVDSVGREFVFAYPTPYVPGFSNRPFLYGVRFYLPTIYLVITNPTSTDFTVDVNLITIKPPSTSLVRSQEVTNARPANISISVDEYFGSTSVISDYFGRSFSSVIDDLGFLNNFDPLKDPPPTIKVTSQGDITVHAYYSYNQRYSAWNVMGTVILPTTALGTDHFIASYAPLSTYYSCFSEFTVTAVSEETTVSISTTDGHRAIKTLQPYESFQYKSFRDLTGSQVSADKSVAVMAGVSAAKIPTDNVDYANYLLAQMPSVGGLGKNYILGPFRERIAGYVFRIVATQDNTFVSISHGRPIELHAGEMFHQDIVSNNITQISSDRPILVVQYNKGYAADMRRGNAAMVVVPAVEMFSSTVMFPVTSLPSKARKYYSLSITIRCVDSPGLLLDGVILGKDTF